MCAEGNSRILLLTIGAHVQRGLQYILALCVSLCVCLSVCLAATAFVPACNQRHLRHLFRLFFFSKESSIQNFANWLRAVFAHFLDQRNTGTTSSTTSQSDLASDASYWCSQRKRMGGGGALRCLEVHWAIIMIRCTVYLEPASKNCTLVLSFS